MDRRTVGLGVAAMVAVGAAVGVTISKHHTHTSRDDVAAYIRSANAVQDDLRYPLTQVLIAYQAFSSAQKLGPAQAKRLETAEKTLLKVRRRVDALDPPAQAKHLHALLVRLIGDEAAVTHEVALFAGFVGRFRAELATVRSASAALGIALAKIHPPTPKTLKGTKKQIAAAQRAYAAAATAAAAAQADAISAYDDTLNVALRQLQRLTPPPAFAPAYRTQRLTLKATRDAGAKLAAGLRGAHRSNVAALGRAFTLASRKSQAISAQELEISAIRAYNARVRRLGLDASALHAEVVRLQRVLP